MPLPTVYTDATLETFMWNELQSVASAVDLNPVWMAEAVNDVMLEYGVTDLADATDIKKLRAIARYHAWLRCVKQVSADYQFSEAGVSYARQQAMDGLMKMLNITKQEAAPYLSNGTIGVYDVEYTEDPYTRLFYQDL